MKRKIIIIGKKSFLAFYIKKHLNNKLKILLISFKNFIKLDNSQLEKYDYICNCSISKNYQNKKYKLNNDIDIKIVNKIKDLKIKYIFLSSRKVYKPKKNLSESSKLAPIDNYAKNKLITENKIQLLLKKRSLILRISNIIGKPIKNPNKVTKNFIDNYIDYKRRNKSIEYIDCFKDFLSIKQFTTIFLNIVNNDLNGIFNVSLGKKIFISEILSWLNRYNDKIFKPTYKLEDNNSFYLNNKKLIKKINIRIKKADLKKYCLNFN